MSKVLPNQVYAGLFEILKNNRLYYHSSIGDNYCHLTEEGKEEVLKWVNIMGPQMFRLEETILNDRAKKLMWEELKK